jgi:hypothetical protein
VKNVLKNFRRGRRLPPISGVEKLRFVIVIVCNAKKIKKT